MVMKFLGFILDILYPFVCVGCGREGSPICERCSSNLRRVYLFEASSFVEYIFYPFVYEGTVRDIVLLFKYGGVRAFSRFMGEEMGVFYKERGFPVDVVVPVPLHRGRLRERGYNQAELLAVEVGRVLGIPVDTSSLLRVKSTRPQATIKGRDERMRNVRGVFRAAGSFEGRRVLLVDDVFTTGATMEECGRVLKGAGAERVYGLAFAREV